ncbi:hypothetical protein L1S32_06010 [Methanogenium sp. S4BF]|uniref:hypothetical protein n=1 Tax=Methanogenium sp. S4BF TaxID=1789226 RepID=UPI002417A65E|nr:hypothetical protein [Methanogenium sp. S4BF]WFN35650.1 hypothetical protein L1S32_06010 [Methanogenium sp. S4BF]
MTKSRKIVLALTGLAVLCVCAAMAAPLAMGDGTGQRGMMKDGTGAQAALEKLQADGIDTTGLETALANDDREAVHAFLQANRPADAPAMNEDRPAMNEERMQEMIRKMQANGVDTTALETALESGDREAVRAFMEANRPAMNEERMQEMIRKMQANGVDTTALETALESGDREAVHAFLQENRPADAGTGLRHGGPSAE